MEKFIKVFVCILLSIIAFWMLFFSVLLLGGILGSF